ncbi:MAG: ROK family protein [Selenomonadaceae bacterium]|nr:ROK family protein [Selenomonadaceae bacterium]
MSILKLKPACKEYIWGGRRLIDEYNIDCDSPILAEAWQLSCQSEGASTIINGEFAGKTLQEYIELKGRKVLGKNCRRFRDFPILSKFIDAKDNLSIQVHPNNRFALQNEGQYGKCEMWYIIDTEPGAFLYYGFKHKITKDEFAQRIKDNTLLEVLNAVPVQKGDALFIEAGTLHAIGKGILLAEIQQNSKITYRVYDYGRVGADGKKRDLHIEKALAVTNTVPIIRSGTAYPHIADCDYFTVDKLNLDGKLTYRVQGTVYEDSFLSILILDGAGTITNKAEKINYKKGDSLFLPANSGDWQIEGTCDALLTTIREKANPIRVGVNISSSDVQIGIVNEQQQLIAVTKYPINPKCPPSEIINETAQSILKLIEGNDIPLDQCVGVGVGVPGTIDRRQGTVVYSNNIRWEDVALVKELGEKIPCPVRINNNADCAALGEAIAGVGKHYSDVVMFTLGNGVGGGIILDGEIFEGGIMGGTEVGHQVIRVNGRLCSCGRRGCLEAYVSIPALIRAASQASGQSLTLDDIFNMYEQGDVAINEVIEQYVMMLGQGIVNIVNIFRPQLIILGGEMSVYADRFIDQIKNIIKEECFGGVTSLIPEVDIAELGSNAGVIGAANL